MSNQQDHAAHIAPHLLRLDANRANRESSDFRLPWFAADSAWLGHLPFAAWLVHALRPARIVELGVFSGTSFLAFSHAAKHLGIGTRCHGVDTWKGDEHAGTYPETVLLRLSEHIKRHYGSDVELMRMTFDEAAGRFADGSVDLLHIDGLHYYESVKHDLKTWQPKLSSRGLVLFHDIAFRERGFGVHRLWDELSAIYPHFAFEHSFGLGVLGIGTDIPPAVARLFDATQDKEMSAQTRRHFETHAASELKVTPPPLWLRLTERLGFRDKAVRAWRKGWIGRP